MRRIVKVRGVKTAWCLAVLALAAPGWLPAQRGGGHFGGAGFGARANFRAGFGGEFVRYGGFGAVPLLDPLYSDWLYSTGYPVAAQPPVIIVQAGALGELARARTEMAPPAQPLMIELQDGRYVQVSGETHSGAQMLDGDSSRGNEVVSRSAPETPAAVLVFRDGHQEQVSGYTIADGVLYASGDFYSGGSWDKKIELSSLNLEETVRANRSRGLRFRLPAARNEVMVGP